MKEKKNKDFNRVWVKAVSAFCKFRKGHFKSDMKKGSGGGNFYYISSVIINNEDQSYSGYTEADGKHQYLPQRGACQFKKNKDRKDRRRARTNLIHFHSLAECTVYLSCYPC